MRLLIALAAASLISAGLADPEALTIAVPGETIPAEKTAARELSGYLERMTGRRVAVVPEDKVAGAAAIHLGATAFAKKHIPDIWKSQKVAEDTVLAIDQVAVVRRTHFKAADALKP